MGSIASGVLNWEVNFLLVLIDGDDANLLDEEEFLKQGALQTISDNPVISRARASLPSQLQIFKVDNNKVGKKSN